jgi:MFS family permease
MSASHSQEDNNKILPQDSTISIETKNSPLTLRNKGTASLQAPVPYSVFTIPQKRWITFVIAFIAWFSTLSSFIYFPALSLIAADLHTSIEGVNLTVTSYLIASAIIPSIIAPLADMKGRRPIYMITFSIYFIANTGLALQKSLVGLILLRVVQSVGISGAFAITYGAIADIASPAERGSYVGVVALGFANFLMSGWLVADLLQNQYGSEHWPSAWWYNCGERWLAVDFLVSQYRFWLLPVFDDLLPPGDSA